MDGDFDKEYTFFGDDQQSEQASHPIGSSLQFHPSGLEVRANQCIVDIHPNDHASPAVGDINSPSLESHNCADIAFQKDEIGDAAAIIVWLYLLLVSSLLVGAVVMGSLLIVKYGFVVFVAVVAATGAAAIVAGTFVSAITGDAMLTKARSKVNAWHVVVKDAILEEIHHFTEDLTAYSDGTLFLTYGHTEEFSSHDENENGAFEQDVSNQNHTTAFKRKPKSIIFQFVISPITKVGKNIKKRSSTTKSRSWLPKKKENARESSSGKLDSMSDVPPIV